jgi:hypothetical protein
MPPSFYSILVSPILADIQEAARKGKRNTIAHHLSFSSQRLGLAPVFVANLLILGSGPACDMLQCIVSR